MSREIELLTEIRDLLLLLAEPALAQRDQKFRDALRKNRWEGSEKHCRCFSYEWLYVASRDRQKLADRSRSTESAG